MAKQSDVFISYRRKDKEFVQKLDAALRGAERDIWIDWEDIPPGSLDFQEDIQKGIDQADAFLLVLSPDYLQSEYCLMELDYAHRHNKRLVPILYKPVQDANVPSSVSHINWVNFSNPNNFNEAFQQLITAMDTDHTHVRIHTRLLVRAKEWENGNHEKSLLLNGNTLKRARQWLEASATRDPQPAELHHHYIKQSREAEVRQQRINLGIFAVGLLIVSLALFAFYQSRVAENQKQDAIVARDEARQNAETANSLALAGNSMSVLSDANTDLAISLALTAAEIDESPLEVERALATASYEPGTERVFEGHLNRLRAVTFVPNSQHGISAADDGNIILWDLENGTEVRRFAGHDGGVITLDMSVDGSYLLSGGNDTNLIWWDVATGERIRTFEGHFGRVRSVALSPDGSQALSGSEDGTMRLWDIATGQEIGNFNGRSGSVIDVAFSPDGRTALSAHSTGNILWWNLSSTESSLRTLTGHEGWVTSVAYHPDGERFVSAGEDRTVRIWSLKSGAMEILKGHADWVLSVEISHDGLFILSSSSDESVRLWDIESRQQLMRLAGHDGRVWSAAFSLEENFTAHPIRVLSGGEDNQLRLWDLLQGGQEAEFGHLTEEGLEPVTSIAASADGRHALSGTESGILRIWELENDTEVAALSAHQSSVLTLAYSPVGNTALSGASDGEIIIWDTSVVPYTEHLILREHSRAVETLAYLPDGQFAISGSADRLLILWDLQTGEAVRVFGEGAIRHSNTIGAVAIHPSGNIMASGGFDNRIILWDIATGEGIREWEAHDDWIRSLAFDPTGTTLFSGADDNIIVMWDVETGAELRAFEGHIGTVTSLGIGRDGTRILSGSGDQTVRVWDVASGLELRRFEEHTDPITDVTFGATQNIGFSASEDGTVRMWRIDRLDALVEWVRNNRYVRLLTANECLVYRVTVDRLCQP